MYNFIIFLAFSLTTLSYAISTSKDIFNELEDTQSPFDVLKSHFETAKQVQLADLPLLSTAALKYSCTSAQLNTQVSDLVVLKNQRGPVQVNALILTVNDAGPLFPETKNNQTLSEFRFLFFGTTKTLDATEADRKYWGQYYKTNNYNLKSTNPLIQQQGTSSVEVRFADNMYFVHTLKDNGDFYYYCWLG